MTEETKNLKEAIAIAKRLMEDMSQKLLVEIIPTQVEHGKELARLVDRLSLAVKDLDRVRKVLIDGNGDSVVTKIRLNQRDLDDLKEDFLRFKAEISSRRGENRTQSHSTKVAIVSAAVAIVAAVIQIIWNSSHP